MAFGAVRRELGRSMVRARGGIVIGHVAGTARCRRARITVRMALDAGCGGMSTMQGEAGVVVVEGGVAPCSLIMASRAVRAEARSDVVRLGGAVVIGHVAGATGCWCTGVSVRVAFDARSGDVRSVQREVRVVVVEGGVAPCGLIVAHGAVRAEARGRVVGVRGAVVIRHVAGAACGWCAGISIGVAFDASRGHVRTVQGEVRDVMVEGCRPSGAGGMAARTVGREAGGNVVRVRRPVVLRQVATRALRGGIREIARGVATRAVLDVVAAGEGEEIMVRERRSPTGAQRIMALDAIGREARAGMVREGGGLVLITVAVDAVVAHPLEGQRVVR